MKHGKKSKSSQAVTAEQLGSAMDGIHSYLSDTKASLEQLLKTIHDRDDDVATLRESIEALRGQVAALSAPNNNADSSEVPVLNAQQTTSAPCKRYKSLSMEQREMLSARRLLARQLCDAKLADTISTLPFRQLPVDVMAEIIVKLDETFPHAIELESTRRTLVSVCREKRVYHRRQLSSEKMDKVRVSHAAWVERQKQQHGTAPAEEEQGEDVPADENGGSVEE